VQNSEDKNLLQRTSTACKTKHKVEGVKFNNARVGTCDFKGNENGF
jgi:hypothetical protein